MTYLYCCQIGGIARRLLASRASGRVLAGFSQAAYLLTEQAELFWLAAENAPMHARCLRIAGAFPRLAAGEAFSAASECIRITSGLQVDCRAASTWTAPPLPGHPALTVAEVSCRVYGAFSTGFDLSPASGLGRLIPRILALARGQVDDRPETDLVLVQAWPAIYAIGQACRSHDAAAFRSEAAGLIGLGEGLTPSGDDFLGSLLFVLNAMHKLDAGLGLDPVAQAPLVESARRRTHPISFALLRDLAAGEAVEPLHELIGVVYSDEPPDSIRQPAARLIRIGHATGWDLLAGALAGLVLTSRGFDPPVPSGAPRTHIVCA